METVNFENLSIMPLNEAEMMECNGGVAIAIIGILLGFIIGMEMVL